MSGKEKSELKTEEHQARMIVSPPEPYEGSDDEFCDQIEAWSAALRAGDDAKAIKIGYTVRMLPKTALLMKKVAGRDFVARYDLSLANAELGEGWLDVTNDG